jgi:hypothetical protein
VVFTFWLNIVEFVGGYLVNTSFPKEIRMRITINVFYVDQSTSRNNGHVRVSMQCTASWCKYVQGVAGCGPDGFTNSVNEGGVGEDPTPGGDKGAWLFPLTFLE